MSQRSCIDTETTTSITTSSVEGASRLPVSIPVPMTQDLRIRKGWQSGGTIGVTVVAPIAAYFMYRSGKAVDFERIMTVVGRSGGVGVGLSALMCTTMYSRMDQEGLEDRVYRLHYNEGQNRVDQFSGAGTFLGAILAAGFISKVPSVVLGGGAVGTFAGVLAHMATKKSKED